ncbi:RadC family protein [Tepidibacillus fermentans]|uniref:DNA replication and repair protein RadC n=1 Tax=Tepidibacillus fermentans TaxID=1281767 RepID=A0A4R3K861_9BACI|nr:DNA repair protein RadC [Tepidibacillus fermentans]TCS79059.1 DNA replication and repair protein RadC [Tepidibacillus fermentans]
MDKKNIMVRDVPLDERPRERLMKYGAEQLSSSELLAIILRTGSTNESVLQLATKILSKFETLQSLYDVTIEELMMIKGVGKAKAIEIKAAIEFGKRIVKATPTEKETIRSPRDVFAYLGEDMRFLRQEHFVAILLDTKNHIIAKETISVGSLNASIVHPREVFKPAIKKSASAMIVAHNHPSGDPSPSREDIEITKRLYQAGEILGIDLLDHVIIGEDKYTSLKEKGLIG